MSNVDILSVFFNVEISLIIILLPSKVTDVVFISPLLTISPLFEAEFDIQIKGLVPSDLNLSKSISVKFRVDTVNEPTFTLADSPKITPFGFIR